MSTRDLMEPHAQALESCAAAMEAAGIGGHISHGHPAILRRMAQQVRSEAALGRIPHRFDDSALYASADDNTSATFSPEVKSILDHFRS